MPAAKLSTAEELDQSEDWDQVKTREDRLEEKKSTAYTQAPRNRPKPRAE